MYQACYPLGSAFASYHLFCCIAADRFICRVGTEVTVSVLFSQDHKKCQLLYNSIHKKCLILSSQEFSTNVNHS